ncbi:MAG: cytochrome P450 [Ilumatobacteraceae bacterium]
MTEFVWGGWDDSVRDDPFPTFAKARSRCPVQQVRLPDGHDAWVVLGHDAARVALSDDRLSKNMVAALEQDPEVVAEGLPGPEFAHHMLAMDAPDHGRLRSLLTEAFRPSRVAAMRPAIERLAEELLDRMAAVGPSAVVDLRAGLAHSLPFAVICELLGVDDDRRRTLQDAFGTLLRPWPWPPPPEAAAASDIVTGTLRDLVADARADPDGDLVAVLVDAVHRGEATEREALSSLFQLVVAGHDTTSSLIGNGVVALLDHPDQLAALQREPHLLPGAIEELLRFTAAVPHATFRVTTEPVELAGVTVPAGQQVLVGLGAANRDPSRFVDPDRLDVTRRPRRHLAFGHGAHHCLGAPLARLEAEVAFRRLLDRFPDLRLAVSRDELAWSHGDGLVLRGLAELPVVLGPDRGRRSHNQTTHPKEQHNDNHHQH